MGVDRQDVLLLCDPMDSSVTLSTIVWTVLGGNTFTNPINVFNERLELPVQSTEINCLFGFVSVTICQVNVKGISDQIQYINITRILKYLFTRTNNPNDLSNLSIIMRIYHRLFVEPTNLKIYTK